MSGNSIWMAGFAGVIASATPLLLAVLGETIMERAGLINLSLNGVVILSAMCGFAAGVHTGSVALGFAAGAGVGAFAALAVAFAGITLRRSQVAVGFALMIVCRDLAYFLGVSGPRVQPRPLLGLSEIPVLGSLLFQQDIPTYFGFIALIGVTLWMYRTRPGLVLRGLGERPAAVYARGGRVAALRYWYAVAGGALAGLAGPAYSLNVKAGWMGTISGLDGIGWIALAIVVFGGWNPLRAALGVYLFATLQWLGLILQPRMPGVPSQVLQVAPFPLMILALLLVNLENTDWMARRLARLPARVRRAVEKWMRFMRASPPAALGQPFDVD